MTKRPLLLIIFIFCLVGANVLAQEVKEDRLVTKANQSYDNYSFSPAIDIYKRVLDKGFVSADLLKKLGNSYYFNADYNDAANTYKKLVEEYTADVTPEYYFRYSQTLKTLGDYDNANAMMAKFVETTSDDNRAKAFKGEKDYLEDIKKLIPRYQTSSIR